MTRIITAAVLAAIALVSVLGLPSWGMGLLFGLLWATGAWEWARLTEWSPARVWAYTAVFVLLALLSGAWFDAAGAERIALIAAGWWILAFVGVVAYPWRVPATVVAAAGILALVPSWFLLVYMHNVGPRGPALVLSLLCITWAADVAALAAGKTFGRIKLAPHVSPGKTWEGVVGGLTGATVVALLAGASFGQPLFIWAVVGLGTGLVSIVGDLAVSVCKRRAGRKDSGGLLPGHGGVLDRIDSLTAAAPIFFLGISNAGLLA